MFRPILWTLAGLALALVSALLPAAPGNAPRFPFAVTGGFLLVLLAAVMMLLPRLARGLSRPHFSAFAIAGSWIAAVALFVRFSADSISRTLPADPFVPILRELHPSLLAAIAAGGLLGFPGATGAFRQRRIPGGVGGEGARHSHVLLLAGASGLALHALFPVVQAGVLHLPLLAALKRLVEEGELGLSGAIAVLMLGGAGIGLLAMTLGKRLPSAESIPPLALGLVGIVPLWRVVAAPADAMGPAVSMALMELGVAMAIAGSLADFLPRLESGEPNDTADGEDVSRRSALTLEIGVLSLAALAWWLLKLHGLGYSDTDENIYFYAAKIWAEGTWPYRDFFFSHPPGHIAAPAILFKLFGFSFLLAKLIPVIASFLTAWIVHRAARRHFGRIAGVVAPVALLFASEVLKASTNLTGVNLTTLFLALGVVAFLDRRSLAAGIWFGVAVCTGVYAAGVVAGALVLSAFAPSRGAGRGIWRWDVVRLATGFLVVFGAVHLFFIALAGRSFVDGVYTYHFLKPSTDAAQKGFSDGPFAVLSNLILLLKSRDFRVTLYYHAPYFWLAALTPLAVWLRRLGRGGRRRRPPPWNPRTWWPKAATAHSSESARGVPNEGRVDGIALLVFFLTLSLLAEFGMFAERYDFYYTLFFPLLGLLCGFVVRAVVDVTNREWIQGSSPSLPRSMTPIVAVAVILCWVPLRHWANVTAFPEEIEARGSSRGAGEVLTFEWTPAPVLPEIGDVVRALFWSDTRTRGNLESGVRHYLWSKKRHFSTAEDIARLVRETTTPDQTITGASTSAPLIALLADRRLAGNHVDTNSKVFTTGMLDFPTFWNDVCADGLAWVISAERSAFSHGFLSRTRIAQEFFELDRIVRDSHLRHWSPREFRLWKRKDDGRLCAM